VYSDLPELFPTDRLPATHRFIGAALWEPPLAQPEWWNAVRSDRPKIYVTLGSSGDTTLLPCVVEALSSLPASLMVATAGSALAGSLPDNVHVAAYLPGMQAAQRARLVICNGGSLTAYQALAGGAAILGIAGNLDQFLNMQEIERAGIGRVLRADRLSATELRAEVAAMLDDSRMLDAVGAWRSRLALHRFEDGAAQVVQQLLD
jgi:UDP:flavonoid glycosyltransferase YjiC (YdhE family)